VAERLTAEEPAPRRRLFDRQVIGPFTGRQLAIGATAVVVLAFILLAATTPLAHPADTALPQPGSNFFQVGEPTVGLQAGQQAPELTGTHDNQPITLTDLAGQPITLAAIRGRPVWLNFWATWCPPCQEETPILRDVYAQYKTQGLALVAVSVQETSVDDVRSYVATYGLDYTVGFDATSAVFHTYRAFGLPTQFFIDRNGLIRTIVLGPVTREQAGGYIAELLAAP
jgi:cytochrome c biogenesis protein CcmG, thiol:disulfide interchange protein DsbE